METVKSIGPVLARLPDFRFIVPPAFSLAPEVFKPSRRKLCVFGRVLNVLMAQIGL
jgi:hypothetical protein